MTEIRYSLCPNCYACPEVVISDETVLIGEEGNQVRLTVDEWNVLVDGVRSGALAPVSDPHNIVCAHGTDCC
jgi:hypothetical protein